MIERGNNFAKIKIRDMQRDFAAINICMHAWKSRAVGRCFLLKFKVFFWFKQTHYAHAGFCG